MTRPIRTGTGDISPPTNLVVALYTRMTGIPTMLTSYDTPISIIGKLTSALEKFPSLLPPKGFNFYFKINGI